MKSTFKDIFKILKKYIFFSVNNSNIFYTSELHCPAYVITNESKIYCRNITYHCNSIGNNECMSLYVGYPVKSLASGTA